MIFSGVGNPEAAPQEAIQGGEMDEQPGSVEATASLVALALADAPAGDLMQQSFSLMVLDFDRDLFLISRGGVTRDGQGANAATRWCNATTRRSTTLSTTW